MRNLKEKSFPARQSKSPEITRSFNLPHIMHYCLLWGGIVVSNSNDLVNRTLDALERLMRMFAIERYLYLVSALISFILLVIAIVRLINDDGVGALDLSLIFGATGLIAASAARVSYFLNKSFDLISSIIQRLAEVESGK
ncbi:hypothetical protein N6L26_09245 [Qipengyuania sp. SS22]|uniref:hypothetical protein n=1 Tax=Qipengyuania sp. SS22 TaxID=2979461 RepID=UPI0021E61215|nr:hypothetical protein [Qipengyuania sp. SS22]UYH54239.1 hypothetical protein N6L26_09245 [Qipengyuania sp. SS22]